MILRALFLRPVLHRPARFVVTVVGVAVGVAAVVATVSANRAAVASLRRSVEEISGRAALEVVRPGGVPDTALAAFLPVTDLAVVAPVVDQVALVPALDDAVRVLGVDVLLPGTPAALGLEGGRGAAAHAVETLLRGRAVLLPEGLAKRLRTAPGGRVELSVQARRVSVEVAGVFRPPGLVSAWNSVVVTDVAEAQELFGSTDRVDRVELRPRRGVTVDELAALVRPLLPAGARLVRPAARSDATGRMVRALDFNLTALSGISLLVGAVLVATTLATSVVQRRSLIALLRSLGASPAQLAGAVLAEAAAIGSLGGVLGVAGGALGARAALASVRATVAAVVRGVPPSRIELSPAVAAAGFLLALVVSLAAAVLPLREALRTPPIQGLRRERPDRLSPRRRRRALAGTAALGAAAALLTRLPARDGLPVAALAASLALLCAVLVLASPLVDRLAALGARGLLRRARPSLRLAAAALGAGRRRAAWAAGAVGVTVGLAVAVTIMVHSFRTTVVDWSREALRSDVWVRPLAGSTGFGVGRLDPAIVGTARRLFGNAAVDPFYSATVTMDGRRVTLGAGEMAVVARRGGVPFLSGRDSRDVFRETLETHGAVVNEPFARRFGVRRGAVVHIPVPGGSIARRVTGVFYDYSHQEGMVVIDANDFLALYPDDGPAEMGIYLPPGADPAAARARLLDALHGRFLVEAFLNGQLRREVVATFDRTFAITTALRLVAGVVAVIAVLAVLFALVSERRRDLAVLRALGASRGQVAALVVAEAGLLGFAGVLSGFAAGALVGKILVTVVNVQSFAWTLRFLPPWVSLAFTAAALVAATLLAGAGPALAAARITPREELRDEG